MHTNRRMRRQRGTVSTIQKLVALTIRGLGILEVGSDCNSLRDAGSVVQFDDRNATGRILFQHFWAAVCPAKHVDLCVDRTKVNSKLGRRDVDNHLHEAAIAEMRKR